MNTDIETLLCRLDGVRARSGRSWLAKCPAHEDKSPSLSITDTGTRTLIHCFAGCEAEDVLTAVGLTWRDIIRDEYTAANGAAAHRKVKLPHIDPLAIEQRIIDLAESDLKAGKILSAEDRARVEVAVMRLESMA